MDAQRLGRRVMSSRIVSRRIANFGVMKAKAASSIIWQAQLLPASGFRAATTPGHTVVNDLGTFKLHQPLSGVFNPDCLVVLGPGMVI